MHVYSPLLSRYAILIIGLVQIKAPKIRMNLSLPLKSDQMRSSYEI